MIDKKPKWHIRKRMGRWIVHRPSGAHFGTYFTWTEAAAQVIARSHMHVQGGTGGSYERSSDRYFASRVMEVGVPFGFAQSPYGSTR